MEQKTKLSIIQEHLKAERYPEAFKLAKTFFVGFTKEQKRVIDIAAECHTGKKDFYEKMGINTEQNELKAIQLLTDKYLKQS